MNKIKKFNNGIEIPMLGLGVYQTKDGNQTVDSVKWALEAGYRHIDTAAVYGNESSVGRCNAGLQSTWRDRRKSAGE